MKKIAVIVLVGLGIAFAGASEAASPKKHRTRNQNRIGPYVAAFVGMTKFTDDQSAAEAQIEDIFNSSSATVTNLKVGTDDSDLSYQANFGYRFHRYIAGELGLVQYGELASRGTADMDFGDGNGAVPVSLKYSFKVGGPVISVLGILPFGDKFEAYVRAGLIFASTNRELASSVDGHSSVGQTAQGDSQNAVYGIGLGFNINPGYSVRAEYQSLKDVGEKNRNGTEDFNVMSLGVVVRF
jgi:hypothetical protein